MSSEVKGQSYIYEEDQRRRGRIEEEFEDDNSIVAMEEQIENDRR